MDNLKRRRIELLWLGVQKTDKGVFTLDENTARDAGYVAAFGEERYPDVLKADIHLLENQDLAIEVATDHPYYESYTKVGLTPYRLTIEGEKMLDSREQG